MNTILVKSTVKVQSYTSCVCVVFLPNTAHYIHSDYWLTISTVNEKYVFR